MQEDAPLTLLKALPGFDMLTTAEALVFERGAERRQVPAGTALATEEVLLVIESGAASLRIAKQPDGRFATVERGGLIGELDFFEPDPVPLSAVAEGPVDYLVLDGRFLRRCFRYTRTGAIKFMSIFALNMSSKIRSANDHLRSLPPASAPGNQDLMRPSQLGDLDIKRLKALSASRSYGAGETVFREGDTSGELFVITDGEVEILKGQDSDSPLSLATLGAGDFFGEMAFVDQLPRSAAAVARGPLQVQVLPQGALEHATEASIPTAIYLTTVICKIMARRLNSTLRRIEGQR